MQPLENTNTNDTVSMPMPMNRAQRRAMEKKKKRAQTKQNRMIANYIKRHPEAIQFNIDEDKIAEIENETETDNVMTSGFVQLEGATNNGLEFVTTTNRGKRELINPIDEKSTLSDEDFKKTIEAAQELSKE